MYNQDDVTPLKGKAIVSVLFDETDHFAGLNLKDTTTQEFII